MKLAFQLAYKNLIGAGLRTWLNVGVLAFTFLLIVFFNALLDGWNAQAKRDSIDWEFGLGQLIHPNFDPNDPFSIQDGHGIQNEKVNGVPILIQQGTIYPEGRMLPILLCGIEQKQNVVQIPTNKLFLNDSLNIPIVIGKQMANAAKLEIGDEVMLRWRDANGTFDAKNLKVAFIFKSYVPTVDNGKIWLDLNQLQEMTKLQKHATYYILNKEYTQNNTNWKYKTQDELLSQINEIIAMKKVSTSITYMLLLTIALLAIFDTQVLSIFRRQKEIGTYMALGMTRWQVVSIFTVEGAMYSIFALVIGSLIGIPTFGYLAIKGITFPSMSQDMGVAMADKIFPVFGITLLAATVALVVISATIVSFLPAKKIAKMNPVDALKGKLQ